MSFATDLEAEVKRIFRQQWETSIATVVPEAIDIALEKNEAKIIDDGTVLYADLSGSTNMVQNYSPKFAAEVYRAYPSFCGTLHSNAIGWPMSSCHGPQSTTRTKRALAVLD